MQTKIWTNIYTAEMCSLYYCSPPTQDVGGMSPQLHCTSAPQYILLSDPPKAMDKDFFLRMRDYLRPN